MKFTLNELQKHTLRCTEKLMNEIINDNQYSTRVNRNDLETYALNKASSIIDTFLHDGLINNNSNLSLDIPFNLEYCISNNFDVVELSYQSNSIKWLGYAKETA